MAFSFFFFFNDTATTEIYTLSLHDALPICVCRFSTHRMRSSRGPHLHRERARDRVRSLRSEEHTSELQSPDHLVCRLLLEKKKKAQVLENPSRRLQERCRACEHTQCLTSGA